jgi:hypothetical protein
LYVFFDGHHYDKILALKLIDSREANAKSVNMEKLGFTRAVDDLVPKSPQPVVEIVTDENYQIKCFMSK